MTVCHFDRLPESVLFGLLWTLAFSPVEVDAPGSFYSTILGCTVGMVGPLYRFNKRAMPSIRTVLERVVFHRSQIGFSAWTEKLLRGGSTPPADKVTWLALPKESSQILGGAQAAVLFLVTPVLVNLTMLEVNLVDTVMLNHLSDALASLPKLTELTVSALVCDGINRSPLILNGHSLAVILEGLIEPAPGQVCLQSFVLDGFEFDSNEMPAYLTEPGARELLKLNEFRIHGQGDGQAGPVIEAILRISGNLKILSVIISACNDETIACIVRGVQTHDLRCLIYSPHDIVSPCVLLNHTHLKLVGVKITRLASSDSTALHLLALLSTYIDSENINHFAVTLPGREGDELVIAERLLNSIQSLCEQHSITLYRRIPSISEICLHDAQIADLLV